MSKVFRAIFLREFMAAWQAGKLKPPPCAPTKAKEIVTWRRGRYRQDWVVYAKTPFGGPDAVVEYLGRYTHKTAISNHRLIDLDGGKISFHFKDYRDGAKHKSMQLCAMEFLRRFCLHILPTGFRRIRHYGILSNYHKTKALTAARNNLGVTPAALPEKKSRKERVTELLEKYLDRPISDCRECGGRDTLIRILIPPNCRAPPGCGSVASL